MKKLRLCILILLTYNSTAFSQKQVRIDSLKQLLQTRLDDRQRVDVYNLIAHEYRSSDSAQVAHYVSKAVELSNKTAYYKGIADAYYPLGWVMMHKGHYLKAAKLYNKTLEAAQKGDYKIGKANAYNGLGVNQWYKNDFKAALRYLTQSLEWRKQTNDQKGMATNYSNIGLIHSMQGNYLKALAFQDEGLEIRLKLNDKRGISASCDNIGAIYTSQGNYPQALKVLYKALSINKEIGAKNGMAYNYSNLGLAYTKQGNYPKALEVYTKALKLDEALGSKSRIARTYDNLGIVYSKQGNYHKALGFYQKALKIREQTKDKNGMALSYNNLGLIYTSQNSYSKALAFFQKALTLNQEANVQQEVAANHNNMGTVYYQQGKYDKALLVYNKALKISEKIGNKNGVATGNLKLGKLSLKLRQFDKAQAYLETALSMRTQMGEKDLMAEAFVHLGMAHYQQTNYTKAKQYLVKGVKSARGVGNPVIVRDGVEALANVYQHLGNYKKAYECQVLFKKMADSLLNEVSIRKLTHLEASYTSKKREDSLAKEKALLNADIRQRKLTQRTTYLGLGLTSVLLLVALFFFRSKQRANRELNRVNADLDLSVEGLNNANEEIQQQQEELRAQHAYLEESYKNIQLLTNIGQEIIASLDLDQVLFTIYTHVNKLMDATIFGIGIYYTKRQSIDFRLAIERGQRYKHYSRSTLDKQQLAVLCIEQKASIRTGNIQQEYPEFVESFNINTPLEDGSLAQMPRSAIYLPLLLENEVVGLISVQSFEENAYTDRHFKLLKNLSLYVSIAIGNAQMFEQLDNKNQDITASITYAKRIQRAILPFEKTLKRHLPDHFVLFKPRDIVSGDFYWVEEAEGRVFIAVGDCTGHGVPGAFMTILGSQALTNIIIQNKVYAPKQILTRLDLILRYTLRTEDTQVRDGMDIALCVIDKATQTMQFVGAKSPLMLVQNGQLTEVKGDTNGINEHHKQDEKIQLTVHNIDVSMPTTFYLYSDGYQDQFGGMYGRKFMKKRFRELLHSLSANDMTKQKEVLEQTLLEWVSVESTGITSENQEPGGKQKQVDDILVLGVKWQPLGSESQASSDKSYA
ncbi:tetratricopeptide repeat protein [Microscilla marina]|uniref:Serine/threonine protein kinases, putative n=1 Tax=Microscilla marina ATCC 23134 TaxID=313606 RepID=A1ZUD2_MICM2|nr:tetratricopeptide repeat protein [Microscilla marina]EAY25951.1 serine/threonine protein kinases, putative [Microscilla marina ATCC 23134]